VSYPIGQKPDLVGCTYCHKDWFQRGTADRTAIDELLNALPVLAARKDNPNMLIQLELTQKPD